MKRVMWVVGTAMVLTLLTPIAGDAPASAAPFTYLRLESDSGDPIGGGTDIYLASGTFGASEYGDSIYFDLETPEGDRYSFGFGAPEPYDVGIGPYPGAEARNDGNPVKPWIDFTIPGDECLWHSYELHGDFTVGELVPTGFGDVDVLAIDFEARCGTTTGPAIRGELRFNSTSETLPPAPDDDGDGVPNTLDSCPGVVSAITADSDGDRISDPCDPDFTITYLSADPDNRPDVFVRPADALLEVFNTGDFSELKVTYSYGSGSYSVGMRAPEGEALGVGVYEVTESYPTASSGAMTTRNLDYCSGGARYGQFEVYEIETSGDDIVRFSADLTYGCRATGPRLNFASIRLDADNTPVSVSGVTRIDGVATAGVTVEAINPIAGTVMGSTTSGSGGSYSMGVYPTPVLIRASKPGMVTQWLGPHVHEQLTESVLPDSDGISGLAVDLHAGGVIAGRAIPTASELAYEATVYLYSTSGEALTEIYEIPVYDPGGVSYYEVFGWAPGDYHVLLVPATNAYAATWYPDAASFFGSEPVTLVDGELTTANVVLPESATIEVTVLTPEGELVDYPYTELYNALDVSGLAGRFPGRDKAWYVAEGTWYLFAANYDATDDIIWDYFPEWYEDAPHLRPDLASGISVEPGDQVTLEIYLEPLFADMFGSVFIDDIVWLRGIGGTFGCGDGSRFCTDDPVTRGEMAAFLSRVLGLPAASGTDFVDDDDSIFENAIERLAAAGITKGCNPPVNDRFCPDDYVTREQMAAFLVRALGLGESGGVDFVDDDWSVFEDAIERLATAGITRGCNPPDNDRFCPGSRVSRGQMAAFLHRALTLPVTAYAQEATDGPQFRVD